MVLTRTFTADDQVAFAELSGDYNPLHLDPVLARRLLFGRQVVHGLHALLWSLDSCLEPRTDPMELTTVRANFQAGIGVGETVRCRATETEDLRVAIQLETDGTPAAWFEVIWKVSRHSGSVIVPPANKKTTKCQEHTFADVAGVSGGIDLYMDRDLANGLFPNLVRLLPPVQLAVLLATTRLVGMECPGHRSIYASLQLDYDADRTGQTRLNYHVADCNGVKSIIWLISNTRKRFSPPVVPIDWREFAKRPVRCLKFTWQTPDLAALRNIDKRSRLKSLKNAFLNGLK